MSSARKPWNTFLRRISRVALEEQGSSLLEMALLMPLLTLLMLGIVEVGRYAELAITVANAARAGVQYGAQSLADANDTQGITNAASYDAPITPALTVTPSIVCYCSGVACDPSNPCVAPNTEIEYVKVTATGTFTPLFSYSGLPSFPKVNSTAQMRVNW